MSRYVVILLATVTLLAGAQPLAAQGAGSAPLSRRSTAARVTWTVIGAAAGFGLGAWFGLHKFDDAVNSDRKVWTAALVGAAAGGVAGGLLSRNVKPTPYTVTSHSPWSAAANSQLPITNAQPALDWKSGVTSWDLNSGRQTGTRTQREP